MLRYLLRLILVPLALAWALSVLPQSGKLQLIGSQVDFVSDAPMERIEAHSTKGVGVMDLHQRTFVVRIPVRSFEGFNGALQREHFMENYMEAERFPNAVFQGKVIEAVDLGVPGVYEVRAKGTFTVHGVAQERIIACKLKVGPQGVQVSTGFKVALADHAIRIPRVVQQKLAPEVDVAVELGFGVP